jgi:hypothetical protein
MKSMENIEMQQNNNKFFEIIEPTKNENDFHVFCVCMAGFCL